MGARMSAPFFDTNSAVQTPWLSDIDAAFHKLKDCDEFIDITNVRQLSPTYRELNDAVGNSALIWSSRQLNDADGIKITLDWLNRVTKDSSEINSIDWGARYLINSSLDVVLDWELGYFYDSTNKITAQMPLRLLADATEKFSINWDSRKLLDTTEAEAMDWSGGCPKLPDYTGIASPVEGMIAFNYTAHTLKYYNGTTWV